MRRDKQLLKQLFQILNIFISKSVFAKLFNLHITRFCQRYLHHSGFFFIKNMVEIGIDFLLSFENLSKTTR